MKNIYLYTVEFIKVLYVYHICLYIYIYMYGIFISCIILYAFRIPWESLFVLE